MDFDFTDDQEQLRDVSANGSTRATTSSAGAALKKPAASRAKPMASWPNLACQASTFPKSTAAWAWARSRAWW